MKRKNYVIGIDYGSDSCRSIIVDANTGEQIGGEVFAYPRWKNKEFCTPEQNIYRQHPLDYIEGLEFVIKKPLENLPKEVRENIRGISVDTTGSTPVAVDEKGTPLALLKEFEKNPNAMFVLWKDHSSTEEADLINKTAKSWGGVDYTKYSGGVYSSEWFWAKLLHIIKVDAKVAEKIYSWVEHCDWIPALLTGVDRAEEIKRSRCSAGHKAMWNEEFGGLPSEEFLRLLDSRLADLRKNMYTKTYTSEEKAGVISKEWANRLGLPEDVVIGIGAFDAHMGAVGGQIKPYSFVKVMGTSTCDILMIPKNEMVGVLVPGICGQVDGSVVEGMIGLEAGQSGFGDIYSWFRELLLWPIKSLDMFTEDQIEEYRDQMLPMLEKKALEINASESTVFSLDWMNGRRTPNANQKLKGAISNLTLDSDAPKIYRSLIEGTAYGAKAIVDTFIEKNIRIDEIIGIGGVAKKSPLIMQVMADVLNKPIKVADSLQTVALGAAIFAAKVSGVYENIQDAQEVIGSKFQREYFPIEENVEVYKKYYEEYKQLGKHIENRVN
ncbi:MAG: ribulokinase [Cetobacterium sp.]|uniref:ribulokinase n=1 Tax=unclassified Cetobacterium TaxID=2630983 RepID=UPI000647C03A|nr:MULTISPECIES: ribulokinase [unclassified Cetobacterium]